MNAKTKTHPAFSLIRYELRKAALEAVLKLEEVMVAPPWQDRNNVVSMCREDGQPARIGITLVDDGWNTVAEFTNTFDEFLDKTEEIYGCGDVGWGDQLIDDLQTLKDKITERIERMQSERESS